MDVFGPGLAGLAGHHGLVEYRAPAFASLALFPLPADQKKTNKNIFMPHLPKMMRRRFSRRFNSFFG